MADILDFRVKNGLAVTNTATIESTLNASSTNTGALIVAGGVGVGKNLVVGGNLTATTILASGDVDITSTSGATTTTNGALTVSGGVGIAENLYVGGIVEVGSTAPSSSPESGALVVKGGLGVGGDFYVGGTLYAEITGVASTATNIEGGTAGQVPYQTAPGVTSFYGPGTAGQLLTSGGTGAPSYQTTSNIFVGYAVTATELSGGSAGSLPYQQAAGDTTFLGIGSAETVLTSSGTAPQWSTTGTLQVGRATTATNANNIETVVRTTNAGHYLTFVDSNNSTVASEALYTTSTIVYNPSTRRLAVGGTTAPTATLDVQGSMFVSGVTTVTNTTNATSTATGAFQVRGGAAVGLNLYVGNTASILSQNASTATLTGNALYVAGGVGIGKSLLVTGETLFLNNVTFLGSTTYVLSTNTVVTDNLISIHSPSPLSEWSTDDGLDIGVMIHYYDTQDRNGFLGLNNDSKLFELYADVTQTTSTNGIDLTGGIYGALKLGSLIVSDTTASNSTDTGALIVAGGAGIGKDLYVGGTIYGVAEVTGTITTASNINAGTANQIPYQTAPGVTDFFGPGTAGQILVSNGTTAGGPVFTNTASIYVNDAERSTNVRGGNVAQLVYQSASGITAFVGTGTAGQLLVSQGTTSTGPAFTSTGSIYVGYAENADKVDTVIATANASHYLTFVDSNNASSTSELVYTTSTLVVNPATGRVAVGGTSAPAATLDVQGTMFVSGISTVTNTTNATTTATGALQVRGGAAVGLDLRVGGLTTIGSTLAVTGNTTLTGDLAVNGGDITSSASTFNLLDATVTTLNLAGAGTAITVGATTGYTNIRNLVTLTNTTNASSTITGALRVVGGVGVGGNIYVGGTVYGNVDGTITNANTATNLRNGTAGQVPYQTAPGVTSFYGPGTAGELLISGGTSAPSYANTTSIAVGRATTSTNIAAGLTGSLPYQSGAGATTFLGIGTNSYLLTSNGSAPQWSDPSTLAIGSAAKIVTTATSTNANFYLTFVDSNNATSDNESVYTDAGITYNPSTNDFSVSNNVTVGGDLAVNGGDITSSQTTFNLLNTGVTTGNLFGAGTAVTIGAATGYTQIRNLTTITNTTNATSTSSGALRVYGGVGIAGDSYHGGVGYFINNTNSTSTTTGSLVVTGGAGIGRDLYVGGYGRFNGSFDEAASTTTTALYVGVAGTAPASPRVAFANSGTTWQIDNYNGNFRWYTPGVVRMQIDTNGNLSVYANTTATSTTTGALVVEGGVGIGKDLYVGGTIYGAVSGTAQSATTATNLAGGTAGQIPYQASPGLTSFFGPGSAEQILVSQGVNAPQYTNTASIAVGRATSSTHLIAGAAGSLPYQSAVNLTTFLGIGTAGYILQSSGTAPQWVSTASIFAANANNSENIKTLARPNQAVHYLTFVDSNNATAAYEALYTSATIVFDPGTKYLGIGTASPTSNLEVSGAVKISGIFTSTNSTAASSTTTGALQIAGGIGIGGNIYSGGNGVFAGDLAVNGGDLTSSQTTFNLLDATVTTLNLARAGTAITIGSNSAGSTTIRNITNITTSTTATTSTNGALVVSGGIGVAADVWAAGDIRARNILPPYDGVGVVGTAALTWANGQFTDFTVDGTLDVRGAIDLADSDILRFGSSDDAYFVYDGTSNFLELQLEAAATEFRITDNGTVKHTFYKNGGVSITGVTTITNTTAATASTSGALVVAGGAGIAGDLYVGGTIYGNVSVSGSISTATNLSGGTAGQVPYQTAPGVTSFYGPGTAGQILVSAGTSAPTYTNTGSIYVGYAANANNVLGGSAGSIVYQTAADTTNHLALSGTQKSILTAGASAPTYITNVKASSGTASNTTSTGQSLEVTSGGLGVLGNSYFGDSLGVRTDLKVEGATNATNQTSGSLQVVGGAGFGGDIYAAGGDFGNIRVGITGDNEIDTSSGNLTIDSAGGTVTVDDNLTVVGNLTVQGTTTYVDSTVTNVADPIITIGGGANGAAPTADDNKDRGIAFQWHNGTNARTGFFGFDDSTGFFTFISSATFTNEVVAPAGGTTKGAIDAYLAGGTAMSIPYQSAPNTTAFLAAGTSGYILQTNGTGSAPTWVSAGSLGAGSASTLNTVAQTANASYYLTFVDSNNATAAAESFYTSSTIYYNPQTANLVIGGDLTVSGGQVTMDTTSTRDKYRVYNDSTYAIGFQNTVTFGAINSDWAMTFQNSDTAARGFWWGDAAHTTAQGAMALSTDGKLTVAHSVRLGYGETDTTVPGATYRLDVSGDTYISGNVGIGIAPTYKLHVNGSFAATTKSFVIDHPTKPGWKLRYGSLEGPENGVYVRGRLTGKNVIELPDYWTKLVDPDSITVTLTPIGEHQKLYVKDIKDNTVVIGGSKAVDCFYTVWAERIDVDKLKVELSSNNL